MITCKILILEAYENETLSLKQLLRSYGYEVQQKNWNDDIFATVLNSMPHIILLNYREQGSSFRNICRLLKENEKTKDISIILIDNGIDKESKNRLIDFKIDDYIVKPFHDWELIMKIKNQEKIVTLKNQLQLSRQALEESLYMIQRQDKELNDNLSLASKIQEALIPKSLGNIPNCSFTWLFQPSGKVGGDIFDVFMLDEDHIGLYMIDVMGHGVASSMLAVTLSETLILDVDRGSPLKRKINDPPYYEIIPPLEVINYLNKRFPFVKYHHYFTIFYMILNIKTGVLKYVRAAHPNPILVKNTGEIIELDGYGTPVGFEFNEGYEEKTIYLDSGDHLIVYTDGLMELKDNGQCIQYEGILEYIKKERDINQHHLTLGLNKLAREQEVLKDDLSILEMRWVKFV